MEIQNTEHATCCLLNLYEISTMKIQNTDHANCCLLNICEIPTVEIQHEESENQTDRILIPWSLDKLIIAN